MSEFLENGDDVSRLTARRIAIRALNTANRVEDSHGRILRELGDIRETLDALVELVTKSLSERPPR